ncbi:MAG: diphthine synthase [Thermoplasmata archaeon]|nr:MAG: diphthine synthase [Thermoplasmata archaeon]
MGELIFIGLGLFDESDISVKGLEKAKGCTALFAEFYTASLTGTSIDKIQNMVGKEVRLLDREEMESGDAVIKAAREGTVGVLVAGDPMTATTHIALRLRAAAEGIETRVIPGASIITAAPALLGLHIYKFGRITTLAYPRENYFPTSPYDMIKKNLESDLHTLVLLDIDYQMKRYMRAGQGLELLRKMEEEKGEGVVSDDMLICVLGGVGGEEPIARAGYLRNLIREDFGTGLHCLVIPCKLHFTEAEALVAFGGAPEEILEGI